MNEEKTSTFTQIQFGQAVHLCEEIFSRETDAPNVKFYITPQTMVSVFNPLANQMAMSYKVSLWQQELDRQRIKHPKDWWQYFKERWFPKLALKIWPVEYETFDWVLNAMYPFKKLAFPKEHYILREVKEGVEE